MKHVDQSYFSEKLKLVTRDLYHYTAPELSRELVRLAKVADEDEAIKEAAQKPAASLVVDTRLPELRDLLKIAAVYGEPILLSSASAGALCHAMTTGEPAAAPKRPIPPRDQALCNDGSEPNWAAYAAEEAAAPVSGDVALPVPVVAIESIKLAYEREFLQDWLSAAAEPCGRECCGHGVGGECCGDADPVFLSQSEFLTAMQERLKEVTALLSSQPFSMQIDVALPELPVLPTPALEFKMWDAFGGNQMHDYARTYGQQCSDAALERAAVICEEIAQDHWDQYKGRGKHAPNNPRRADTHADGCSDGANQCAGAIRALKGGE